MKPYLNRKWHPQRGGKPGDSKTITLPLSLKATKTFVGNWGTTHYLYSVIWK